MQKRIRVTSQFIQRLLGLLCPAAAFELEWGSDNRRDERAVFLRHFGEQWSDRASSAPAKPCADNHDIGSGDRLPQLSK